MINKTRLYNHAFQEKGIHDVVKWEIFKIENKLIKITFESCSSPNRQGIFLRSDDGIEIDGTVYPSVFLWFDTAPKVVICKSNASNGLCEFYNVWGKEGQRKSQGLSSGMLIEKTEFGFRYRCNDTGFETDFSKLVFTVENIEE